MRPIADILADLAQPADPRLISQKPVFRKGKKDGEVDFISWCELVEQLNQIAQVWDWEVRTQFLPDRCVIEGKLTIHGSDRSITREATGVEMLDSNGYGDPVYSAEASALRRAMAKFGYALDLWRKDKPAFSGVLSHLTSRSEALNAEAFPPLALSSDPEKLKAKNQQLKANQKVTEKQIARLYAIAKKEAGLNDEDIKRIIKEYANYQSTKDITQGHYDAIIDKIKAARFLTELERKELMRWWRTEKIPDDVAKSAINGMGYDGTHQITRNQINAVKSSILQQLQKVSV